MAEQPNKDTLTTYTVRYPLYKRPLDLCILTVAHICPVLLPIWILLWVFIPVMIWLEDRSPIFYRQKRVGKNGEIFTVLKFRTMFVAQSQADGDPTIPTVQNDPRVTRVGKLLRKTALDELPQILSILKGDMSFVGPRPMPVDLHDEFLRIGPEAVRRIEVRPGLTGFAQVYGSYDSSLEQKLRLDLSYISEMSLLTDVKLLFLSVWNTMAGRWELGHKKKRK